MTSATERDSAPSMLHIAGDMTIYRAAELKPALLAALEQASVLEINLADVTEIDTAGIQLLMLAKKAALDRQSELRLVAHSPAVLDAFELLNLASYFGDPLVMPSAA